MNNILKGGIGVEPKIKYCKAFSVVGLEYYGENKHNEIGEMWGKFNKMSNSIQNKVIPMEAAFGVCYMLPDDKEGSFHYIASIAVTSLDKIPSGMIGKVIRDSNYAVFTHYGKLDTLGETYHKIYQEWLPGTGLRIRADLDFEYYDERFVQSSDTSELDIYIALQD